MSETAGSLQARTNVGSRGGTRISSQIGKQLGVRNDKFKGRCLNTNNYYLVTGKQADNDSEGEAGDSRMYAMKANGLSPFIQNKDAETIKPKFEQSVFDMKYENKKQ